MREGSATCRMLLKPLPAAIFRRGSVLLVSPKGRPRQTLTNSFTRSLYNIDATQVDCVAAYGDSLHFRRASEPSPSNNSSCMRPDYGRRMSSSLWDPDSPVGVCWDSAGHTDTQNRRLPSKALRQRLHLATRAPDVKLHAVVQLDPELEISFHTLWNSGKGKGVNLQGQLPS